MTCLYYESSLCLTIAAFYGTIFNDRSTNVRQLPTHQHCIHGMTFSHYFFNVWHLFEPNVPESNHHLFLSSWTYLNTCNTMLLDIQVDIGPYLINRWPFSFILGSMPPWTPHSHSVSYDTHGYLVVWWVILLVLSNNALCRQSPVWLKVIYFNYIPTILYISME